MGLLHHILSNKIILVFQLVPKDITLTIRTTSVMLVIAIARVALEPLHIVFNVFLVGVGILTHAIIPVLLELTRAIMELTALLAQSIAFSVKEIQTTVPVAN